MYIKTYVINRFLEGASFDQVYHEVRKKYPNNYAAISYLRELQRVANGGSDETTKGSQGNTIDSNKG